MSLPLDHEPKKSEAVATTTADVRNNTLSAEFSTLTKTHLSHFPIASIKTAKENDSLYDAFGIDNQDDYELARYG